MTGTKDAPPDADEPVGLPIQIAGRSLGQVRRRLRLVRYHLDDVLADRLQALPPPGRDGYFIRSVPLHLVPQLRGELSGWLVVERQRYRRHYLPMADRTFEDWWAGFSAKTRSTLARKEKRLARELGEGMAIRSYRTPAEIATFMEIAGALSERTYQARLLQAGLPTGAEGVSRALAFAEADEIRCALLFAGDRAVAYLYMPVEHGVLIYGFLGYDPEFAALSPGTVLHIEAMRRLFAEQRFRLFDFTEGDGAHKAQFGRGSVECADLIVLRRSLRNRAALLVIRTLDIVAEGGKAVLERTGLRARASALFRR